MPRPHWQHPNSLAASDDPDIRRKIRKGRVPLYDLSGKVIDKTALSYSEAKALGFEGPEDAYVDGWHAEGDFEFKSRQLLSMFIETGERSLLSRRETEAVAYYLWGERLPVAAALWRMNDHDGMLWELLAEHPPWTSIGTLMRPTRSGKVPNKGNVQTYVRSAAQKLGTTVPGLRAFAIRGLVHARNREAEEHARAKDRAVLRWMQTTA